jgi:putative ABC transport system substrate-binding protein
VPKAIRVAVLVNPANASSAENTLRGAQEAAPTLGLQIQVLNATTIGEIDAAFAILARERPDALLIASDAFFNTRRGQLIVLTARDRLPAAYWDRDIVAAGGLMSYGTDYADAYHQVGVYTGHILKGASPPTCRSCSRPNSSSSSTCKRRGRSALRCRQRYSRSQTT